MTEELMEMARGSTSLDTICGRKDCEAGAENARALPNSTRMAK